MPNTHPSSAAPASDATARMGSVLDGIGAEPSHPNLAPAREPLSTRLARRWGEMRAEPKRRTRQNRVAGVLGVLALVAIGVSLFLALRPRPTPDYLKDDMSEVLDYTLLSDEFNKLPVRERLALIGELIRRLKGLSSGDSAMMAAFAAGIAGKAREQMEENAAKLVVDAWDEKAKDYASVPAAEREKYLEDAFIDFEKMLELTTRGQVRDLSDEERLARMKRQVNRDMAVMKDPAKRPDNDSMGQMMTFVDRNLGSRTTPSQRVRGEQMLRDMTRHFRGQDVTTGRKKD